MKIKAIAIAAVLTAGSMTGFSPSATVAPVTVTAEAASTLSIEEAAEKLAAAEKKAYNKKKNVTVTVKVPCKSKKQIKKTVKYVLKTTAGLNIGIDDVESIIAGKVVPGFAKQWTWVHDSTTTFLGPHLEGNASLSGKVLTLTIKIKYSKEFKESYEEIQYLGLNVAEIQERVEGMSEKDKAWTIGQWVDEHMYYLGTKYTPKYRTAKKLYEGKATSNCSGLALVYQKYATLLGLDAAYVASYKDNHAWNAVKIDGEVYHLGMQDISDYTNSYETLVINPSREWVCEFYGIKPWDSNYSIGEYCLLTSEERYAVLTDCGDDFASASTWSYRWFC